MKKRSALPWFLIGASSLGTQSINTAQQVLNAANLFVSRIYRSANYRIDESRWRRHKGKRGKRSLMRWSDSKLRCTVLSQSLVRWIVHRLVTGEPAFKLGLGLWSCDGPRRKTKIIGYQTREARGVGYFTRQDCRRASKRRIN